MIRQYHVTELKAGVTHFVKKLPIGNNIKPNFSL